MKVSVRGMWPQVVIVEVAHEVLDRVVGKNALNSAYNCAAARVLLWEMIAWAEVRPGDHIGHREGLSRTGDPEQDLVLLPAQQAIESLIARG